MAEGQKRITSIKLRQSTRHKLRTLSMQQGKTMPGYLAEIFKYYLDHTADFKPRKIEKNEPGYVWKLEVSDSLLNNLRKFAKENGLTLSDAILELMNFYEKQGVD